MNNQAAYQEYRKVQVETANKGNLLLMLYQGCIRFLRLARYSIEQKENAAANNYLIRSQDIIDELMYSLDFDQGGEIADNLYSLYDFMKYQLMEANINKNPEIVSQVEELMQELLETWKQIIKPIRSE